jgi:hypothetical protein
VVAALVAFTDPAFPNWTPRPSFPVLLALTDNTSANAWINKMCTKSRAGQNLLRFYAALLRTTNLSINSEHIPGVDNGLADFLSRPSNPDLLLSTRVEQLFLKHPSMRTWLFFLPNPDLLQLLHSLLFTEPLQGLPLLPKNLGQFVPVESIALNSSIPKVGPMI